MDKLIPAFEATLFDPALGDVCSEMAELGIDTLLDDGVFKSLPIVSLLVGIGKTAQNIHDRNLLKQTVRFINTFNKKTISEEKKAKYRKRLLSDGKFAEEELGRILILLNSYVDVKKSELLAKFYRAYVEEQINWEEFCELSDIVSRVFVADIQLLFAVYRKHVLDTTQCEGYQADRLIALGLVSSFMKSLTIGGIDDNRTQRYLQVSGLGRRFCDLSV